MIRTEIIDGGFIRHWSDDGHDLLQEQTGTIFTEAVDVAPCNYTYAEVESAQKQATTADELPNTDVLAEEAYLLAQANRAIIKEVLGV